MPCSVWDYLCLSSGCCSFRPPCGGRFQRGLPGFPSTLYVRESFHIRAERQTASASPTSISPWSRYQYLEHRKGVPWTLNAQAERAARTSSALGSGKPSRYLQEKKAHCITSFVIPTGFHTSRFLLRSHLLLRGEFSGAFGCLWTSRSTVAFSHDRERGYESLTHGLGPYGKSVLYVLLSEVADCGSRAQVVSPLCYCTPV